MFADLDRRLDVDRAAAAGSVSPASTVPMSAKRAREVAARPRPRAGGSPSRWRRPPRCPARARRRRRPRRGTPTGPMKPGSAPNVSRISASVAGRNGVPSAFWSLISFSRRSPRTSASFIVPSSSTTGSDFSSVGGIDAEIRGDLLDRARVGRRHALRRVQRRGKRGRRRRPRRDLDVRGIARVGERDLVLAGRAGRHVLVRARAAHHPDVRLDPVPAQAAAVEDPVVGLDVQAVGLVEPLLVAVEAVGVLHDELARAQHPGARPRLVALLDLQVVEDQRQVAVRAHLPRDVEGDRLLVRHRQHERALGAVLELEQLRDLAAAGAVPQLPGLEHRHQHLAARRSRPSPHAGSAPRGGAPAIPRAGRSTCPAPSWRTSPARTISTCDSASASAGGSFSVGRK